MKYDERPKKPFQKKADAGAHRPDAREKIENTTVEGKNAVWEALSSGRQIDKLYLATGTISANGRIVAEARKRKVPVSECDRRKLDKMSKTGAHQGVIAVCAEAAYATFDAPFRRAEQKGEALLLIVCDGVTDPHNLGAIIRSAEVSGAHGVIISEKRSAGLNAACAKAAAGALEHIPVVRTKSVSSAVIQLAEKGVRCIAADSGGDQSMYEVSFKGPCAIVIGSEGSGVSADVRKRCACIVSIPQKGAITSLNASNAAAVLLYETYRQRNG